jgi:hypothetical protein
MQWDRAHLEGRFAVRDIVEAARAWVPQMREEGADLVIALAHSGISPRRSTRMMENAALHLAGVEGIDAIVWATTTWSSRRTAIGRGDRCRRRHADGQARRDGRLLGLASGAHRPDAGARGRAPGASTVGKLHPRRSTSGSRIAPSGRWSRATRGDRRDVSAVHRRRWTTSAPRSARPRCRCIPTSRWSPTTPRCRSSARRSLVRRRHPAGHRARGAAGPVGRGALQGRRARRAGLLHRRRAGRPGGDQERGRPVPLPQHADGGADHRRRRCASGWNARPGSSTGSSRAWPTSRCSTPAFPSYNYDVIDGVTYRIDLTQPSRYDTDGNAGEPDARRIVDLIRRRADRRRCRVHRRHQQLPRLGRRELPRRRRLDHRVRGARHQPRRHRALHRPAAPSRPPPTATGTSPPPTARPCCSRPGPAGGAVSRRGARARDDDRTRGRGRTASRSTGSRSDQTTRSTISFLISAMALAGFSPLGQVLAQFMIVWQR